MQRKIYGMGMLGGAIAGQSLPAIDRLSFQGLGAQGRQFETPMTDSIVGILEGVEIKTTDDIKDIRLAKYLK